MQNQTVKTSVGNQNIAAAAEYENFEIVLSGVIDRFDDLIFALRRDEKSRVAADFQSRQICQRHFGLQIEFHQT